MTIPIRAVVFDLGGTLENVYYDDLLRLNATPGLRAILAKHDLDPGLNDADLYGIVKTGMNKYGKWRAETNQELTPERVFSEFVFTALPQERVAAIGEEIAFYWDTQFSKRTVRPETRAALAALRAKGFRLGVISNIVSRQLVPHNLAAYGIWNFFEVVLTSCEFGWRKPSPRIFLEMTRRLELEPRECAYVGDTVSRDVVGAHRAGYGLAIQIKSFLTTQADRASDVEPPDAIAQNLMQVVDLVNHAEG
ncbi:MAG: HAD-IA family hydrolase [Chloroflexi bacterium]|nr:HAD-IA family hydrolase [Chloroflexota bacterium]